MRLFSALIALMLTGCASLGQNEVNLSNRLLADVDRQENQLVSVTDLLEDVARKKVDLEMMHIIGPEIIETFLTLKDKKGRDFNDKVCEAEGLDRSTEILKFSLAISRKFSQRRRNQWAPFANILREIRRGGRDSFDLHRRGLSALNAGLRAHTKDKAWRREMLERVGAPVDQLDAINKASLKMQKIIDGGD